MEWAHADEHSRVSLGYAASEFSLSKNGLDALARFRWDARDCSGIRREFRVVCDEQLLDEVFVAKTLASTWALRVGRMRLFQGGFETEHIDAADLVFSPYVSELLPLTLAAPAIELRYSSLLSLQVTNDQSMQIARDDVLTPRAQFTEYRTQPVAVIRAHWSDKGTTAQWEVNTFDLNQSAASTLSLRTEHGSAGIAVDATWQRRAMRERLAERFYRQIRNMTVVGDLNARSVHLQAKMAHTSLSDERRPFLSGAVFGEHLATMTTFRPFFAITCQPRANITQFSPLAATADVASTCPATHMGFLLNL